jgi:hypothetical protein
LLVGGRAAVEVGQRVGVHRMQQPRLGRVQPGPLALEPGQFVHPLGMGEQGEIRAAWITDCLAHAFDSASCQSPECLIHKGNPSNRRSSTSSRNHAGIVSREC